VSQSGGRRIHGRHRTPGLAGHVQPAPVAGSTSGFRGAQLSCGRCPPAAAYPSRTGWWACCGSRPGASCRPALSFARLSPSPGSLLRPALSFARRSPHARYLPFLGFLALPARLRPADTHRASSPGPVGSALCSVLLVLFPASASLGDASFLAGRSSDSVLRAPLYRSSVMDRSGPLCRARRLVQPRKGLL